MNERIKELLESSIIESSQWTGSKPAITITYDTLDQFAQLIVKDCADMVKDAHKSGGGTYLHVLYERYGIEYPWVK